MGKSPDGDGGGEHFADEAANGNPEESGAETGDAKHADEGERASQVGEHRVLRIALRDGGDRGGDAEDAESPHGGEPGDESCGVDVFRTVEERDKPAAGEHERERDENGGDGDELRGERVAVAKFLNVFLCLGEKREEE